MVRTRELKRLHHETIKEKNECLKKRFMGSHDLLWKEHISQLETFELIYFESLIDSHYLDQYILPKLGENAEGSVKNKLKSFFQAKDVTFLPLEDISDLLFAGNVIFIFTDLIISIQAGDFPKRQPEESALETSIRGPKDGFVEDIKTNISLIRRRLNTSALCLEKYTIGKRSKTKVVLMYMGDLIDQTVLDEIRKRLEKIDTDILMSIYELESFVRDNPFSFIPTMDYSGRPDFIVQAINQGRFALIVDGNPTVSIAPVNVLLQTKSPEDAYINYSFVSIERIIRMFGLLISAFLPGIWIAFTSFNIEQIPYLLVATIAISRFGLPLSGPLEMFIVLFLFELFNEAGLRLPRAIGQSVAVLGGLIIGDAAIRAGLTSPTMLVVAAITYISSFTLVNQALSSGITILRFTILIVSTFFGIFGVLLGFILTIFYFSTLTSFGAPYMGSVAPLNPREFIKAFLMAPRSLYKQRNNSTNPGDKTRGGDQP